MKEFSFIKEFMKPLSVSDEHVVLGIGDDAAVIRLGENEELVVSTDTQVESRHFPVGADYALVVARAIGCAVSDLAAMGAQPLGFTLSLSCPNLNVELARRIAEGVAMGIERYQTPIIGGDTVQGPFTISVTVMGRVEAGQALRRTGAQDDDDLWVTGTLGGSAAALEEIDNTDIGNLSALDQAYWQPPCRLEFGQGLARGIATSCLDLSDGLAGDVRHILQSSGLGAEIDRGRIPINPLALGRVGRDASFELAFQGGDDYELLFTAPASKRQEVESLSLTSNTPVTRIGRLNLNREILLIVDDGNATICTNSGYGHF
ncbi:thiamine-phosphate kinase [Umboniibacter marinipuniceus]|uniref:Thiamine-monophosphate kinase n=1 Tax=Umboniibacter marinipuniceus TaxID=569599 RepID=A0A3M0ACZ2_9GAMM|nr:thiamine-phosphate kinase [Umboniibacter marinipuniceus]RMA82406.1 thiamine-phosphate kinase [Umboniibacter marinipuniceus]